MGAVKIRQVLRSRAAPAPVSTPIITTEILPTATVKTAYQAQVEGFDPSGPGSALSLTISNLPAGLSQGPCIVAGPIPTPAPTPTCSPLPPECQKTKYPDCVATMGIPEGGWCSPTPIPSPTPTGCRYVTPSCPPGQACPQQAILVCPTPLPSPKPTPTSVPPAGCYYQQVQCFREPCDPVLVCPSPTPAPTPIQTQPPTIACPITGIPTTAGIYSVGVVLTNSVTGLSGRKTLSLSVSGPTIPSTPTPTPCLPPPCPPPPASCTYKSMSCSSCGTLICNVTPAPTPRATPTPMASPILKPTPTPQPYIQVLTPNGGEQLTVGQSYTIQWRSSPGIANYLIYLVNSLGQISLINGVQAPNTFYVWKVDSPIMQNTRLHKIKIVDGSQGGVGLMPQDLSDNFFTINSPTPTPIPTPAPQYWWYRFISRFSLPSYLRFLSRPTPTPTSLPRTIR